MQDATINASHRETITADHDAGIWTVTTPSLGLRWQREPDGEVRLASLRSAGREWIASPVPMLAQPDPSLAPVGFRDVSSTVVGSTLTLVGRLGPGALDLCLACTVYPDDSTVHIAIEVANNGELPLRVGGIPSLRLALPRDPASQLHVLTGGRWDDALPPRGYRLESVDLADAGGTSIGAAEDGRSSGEHLPWLALADASGGVLAALVWSGRWSLDVERGGDQNLLAFGLSDFAHRLAPGERLSLPAVVMAGYDGDLDDGANAWRRWVVDHWMPPVPESWPWIQYNHWYAYYGDIDAHRLLAEARLAAEARCEVFVIDDGWFRGRRPDSYVAGWGDWVEDREKFPDGLRAFGERVRALGMRFGLWVEPERADDAGDLARTHPDWIATRQGEPIMRPGPAGPEGVHLCLGNPDVRQWMTTEMFRVVTEYGVDWLKWDYNIGYGLGCDAQDHGHQATDGHYAHTLGLWQVLGDLRAACPELVIENCASGGHRVDLGTLRLTHTNWVSDYTHRAASCRQHVQGAGLFLPLQHLNTWALDDRDATEFRSRMGGAFGVSSFMGDWSPREREAFTAAVAEYRRLRPYLTGERFLLTGPWHQDWDIWQLVHPDDGSVVVLAFRERGSVDKVRVRPRLTTRERVYTVERSDGADLLRVMGAEIATNGIEIELPSLRTSQLVWLKAEP